MRDAMKRWEKQCKVDFHSYLQDKQWYFRLYMSNIYVLNHVFSVSYIECFEDTTLVAEDY